jgi:anti-anti-sigma regulatory factor
LHHPIDGATTPAFTARTALPLKPLAASSRARPAVAQALRLGSSRHAPSTVVISAHGDVDAFNASDLIMFVRHAVRPYRGLVLDLCGVTFFGIEGLSALRIIHRAHTPASPLAVVPSPAVVRVLRLGAPAPAIPIAEDLEAALVAVQSDRPVLQLVTEARQ